MPASKISVTIETSELTWLRRRAKQVHGGNLSAAVVEAARTLRKQEALREFLAKEGVPPLGAEELAAVKDEWRAPGAGGKRRRAR